MSFDPQNEHLLKQALEWFFLLQSESCTDENRRQFNRWLHKNEANQAAYAHAQRLWSDLNQLKEKPDIPGLREARRTRPKRSAARALGLSAFILVASVLVSIGWMEYNAETVTYMTQTGERRTVALSDGSSIDLNTATRLQVRISPLQRKIMLQAGEAIFDVYHEWLRSFSVQAGDLMVHDIGTRFNVRLHNDAVSVAVLQGAVEINGERMNEGYQRNYQPGAGLSHMQPIDIEKIESWKHGRLIFRQSPLREVVTELERYHSVRFFFADPSIANETLSGMFDTDDLDLFLASVEKILPVKVQHLPEEQMFLLDWARK
ncbi:MAG: FecR family protein [Nitrosomonas sp.]|nr:FecR family protein [Nitrosomonas sp.]MBP6075307.1 FecR family protein [Nitrosomonas sp.]